MVLLGLFRKEIRLNVSSASSIALHKMLDDFCFPQAESRNGMGKMELLLLLFMGVPCYM
jgi:hypothetical protein